MKLTWHKSMLALCVALMFMTQGCTTIDSIDNSSIILDTSEDSVDSMTTGEDEEDIFLAESSSEATNEVKTSLAMCESEDTSEDDLLVESQSEFETELEMIVTTQLSEEEKFVTTTTTVVEEQTNKETTTTFSTSLTTSTASGTGVLITNVPYISQKDVLPTGCELVSALMVLQYYGVSATISDVVEHTKAAYSVDIGDRCYAYHPSVAFVGSPYDSSSFGCYSPVVVNMMNELLPLDYEAVDLSGEELRTLAETYIPQGIPVLIWASINMLELYQSSVGWYLLDEDGNPTDEWYYWTANEHCLVLIGYDDTYYYFNDPYNSNGQKTYACSTVEARYNYLGKMAVAVLPNK